MAGIGLAGLFKRGGDAEEEIKQLLNDDNSELGKDAREIIKNVFDFDDIDAGDIMTHRSDISAVDCNAGIVGVAQCAINDGYSRIPVYCGDLDHIEGIAYVKDLLTFIGRELSGEEKLSDYLRKPMFVPETISCTKLFTKMRSEQIQLAIVVDEYGGTSGLVTMEDIVEELVGDIEDEYDEREEEYRKIADNIFIFDGAVPVEDVEEITGANISDGECETLAGIVINSIGYLPDDGSSQLMVKSDILELTVLEVKDRRIEKIKVKINDGTNDNT